MIPNYVVIPFLGKLEMTDALVRQIVSQGEVQRIFLCDNSPEWQHKHPWDDLWHEVETTFCPGWNLHRMFNYGIHQATMDVVEVHGYHEEYPTPCNVGLFNNDITIDTPHFLSRLSSALRSAPNIGQVAATVQHHLPDAPQAIPATYADGFHGACVMYRGELPFRFDDRFQWYYGDSDFQAQIANAGYLNCLATTARYTHIDGGHVSLRDYDQNLFNAKIAQDEVLFYAKWPQIQHGEYWIPQECLYPRIGWDDEPLS